MCSATPLDSIIIPCPGQPGTFHNRSRDDPIHKKKHHCQIAVYYIWIMHVLGDPNNLNNRTRELRAELVTLLNCIVTRMSLCQAHEQNPKDYEKSDSRNMIGFNRNWVEYKIAGR